MANTTNFNWETPDDTDLVKDGAAAIRTLGSSIDTTTKALNPSTTLGDIEYRSATANTNTRLPLGTAGQVLKVNSGATAPEWATDASGMTNPMTTTGDTIYSSSGSTPARLAIGSTGNVLTVAGGVPTWAAPAGASITYADAAVATSEATTSSSYTNLTTNGPEVTLTTSTKALVIISSSCRIDTADRGAYASFAISGATTKSAGSQSGDTIAIAGPEDAYNTTVSGSAACVVTLTAGSNTFTMKYVKGGPSGSATFGNRAIFVMRLN
jgi:hypothetical protein